jgi:hypothetical protein
MHTAPPTGSAPPQGTINKPDQHLPQRPYAPHHHPAACSHSTHGPLSSAPGLVAHQTHCCSASTHGSGKAWPQEAPKTEAAPDQHTLPELVRGLGRYQAKMPSFLPPKI